MSAGDWKDLYGAASAGDLELVRFHLARGVDVDHVHPEYQSTVLVAAILGGHEDVALELIEQGADPTALSELDDLTPIAAAEQVGLDRVRAGLLELGAPAPERAVPRPRPRWWRRRR